MNKENKIIYCLYATYDKKANTLGIPFIAQNNEVAIRKLKQTQEAYKKSGLIGAEDLTVMYLGLYQITPTKVFDKNNKLIAYEDIFQDNKNAYDILNAFEDSREQESREILPEIKGGK